MVEPEPEPVVAEAEPVAAEAEDAAAVHAPLRVVAWDEDAEDDFIMPAAEVVPDATAAEVGPEDEAEDEPVAAESEIAATSHEHDVPEPVQPAAIEEAPLSVAPISQTILRFPDPPAPTEDASSGEDLAAQRPEQAARRAQLDLLGLGDPGEGPVAPERTAGLPYRSRGAAVSRAEMEAHARAGGSFWEASAREVASAAGQIGVQSCGQCGLSLSANARFCRRCGTRQAQSA